MFSRRNNIKTIFFSSNQNTIDEWMNRDDANTISVCCDIQEMEKALQEEESTILIVDYDSVANDINKWILLNAPSYRLIVLEKVPEIATGKMLISRGVNAYGNSRMDLVHYEQMLKTVMNDKIWTYPELTTAIVKSSKLPSLSSDSVELIEHKLTEKESEVVYFILDGLTNDDIAVKMDITTRTVKAHISSIFTKLHVSDRVSLVLLLK